MPGQTRGAGRLAYLDGHRGIAILLVLLFHAFARWPGIVPYGGAYAAVPLFSHGWLGVNLFFLISGFVILMTLERCASVREFLVRRWLRLFPAMLLCSLLLYVTAFALPERPLPAPAPASLLPGLSFLEPSWWRAALGFSFPELEGSFWSLYVECKFYVLAAFVFFATGRTGLVGSLFLANAASAGFRAFGSVLPGPVAKIGGALCTQLSFEYFGWFAAGAAFYSYSHTLDRRWLWTGIAICVFDCSLLGEECPAALLVCALFAGSVLSAPLQRALGNPFVQFLGAISYPLYLLHQNLMVALVVRLGRVADGFPGYLLPIAPIATVCALSYLVANFGEPRLRRGLVAIGARARSG